MSLDEIREWLLKEALAEDDFLLLMQALVWRLVAAGLPLDRVTVHVGTLHPQLLGFYWHWKRSDGLVDELTVKQGSLSTDRFRRSPLALVIGRGERFRARTDDLELVGRYPLLRDLDAEGIREYCALPLSSGKRYHNAVTLGTSRDTGFEESEIEDLQRILKIFALHVERHIMGRIAENVLDTYLGPTASRKVLSGSIRRGSGESIEAIIWMSDLRDYSAMSGRLPGGEMLVVLNAYFECLTNAVLGHGGEVLKFIGDGLLAVFPVTGPGGAKRAAARALAAAEVALRDVDQLNESPFEGLDNVEGWRPLRTGIALHFGEVFFGNVGGPGRLDFTVIGRAVNEVSRVEALTKDIQRPVLVTEPVAKLLEEAVVPMGRFQLRGFSDEVTVFAARGT